MLKPIKDILYEYVYYTPFEKRIIENPSFQRLRFVYQNSSAYFTYPSNALTRFSHSLGVMHLGSLFYINAFNNSTANTQKLLIQEFKNDIDEVAKNYDTTFLELLEDAKKSCEENNVKFNLFEFPIIDLFEKQDEIDDVEAVFIANFICQSVRIACLTHDIGHFPFSHIFENGLEYLNEIEKSTTTETLTLVEKLIKRFKETILSNPLIKKFKDEFPILEEYETKELHEYCGASIIENIRKSNNNDVLFTCIISYGLRIFLYGKKDSDKKPALLALKSIVSSELDADRLDYTMRDAVSSGMQIGNFDYTRLLNNVIFTAEKSGNNRYFSFLIKSNAISSLEQFYNYRFLLYEYVYYHHNVAKYDGIAAEIIGRLFSKAIETSCHKDFLKVLEDFKAIDSNSEIFNNSSFRIYDDSWFRSLLTQLLSIIEENKLLDPDYKELKILISIFLYRENDLTLSLFKTQVDFKSFFEKEMGVKDEVEIHFKKSQTKSKEDTNNLIKKLFNLEYELKKLNSESYEYFSSEIGKAKGAFLNKLKKRLKDLQLVLITKMTKPKNFQREKLKIYIDQENQSRIYKLEDASSYLNNLTKYDNETFNQYFGIVSLTSAKPDREEILIIFEEEMKIYLKKIADIYIEYSNTIKT